jgi:sterol desaturase/sphingolipid hydroxylase (fatty acid hydroxylase superfamily)
VAVWEYLRSQLTPSSYLFWLLLLSALAFLLERLHPWRPGQSWRRPGWEQDLFFLLFNGHIFGLLVALALGSAFRQIYLGADWCCVDGRGIPRILATAPIWLQIPVFLLVKDFTEYLIHYLLHATPLLWRFHRFHHTIETLDWAGNFRFHWMELVVYDALKWLPMLLLTPRPEVLLGVGIFATLWGHLNHANLRIDWGPLRYLLNSPRMHVWHHDYQLHGRFGQNFAVIFSFWDWLFGTAYFPYEQEGPRRLGFPGMERFPRSLPARLFYPLGELWQRRIG